MALPAVEEPCSLTVEQVLGMLEHTVLGKSMIPHCSAGAASGDPTDPTAALGGGMFNGGAGNRGAKEGTCEVLGDWSELKAAASELCTCVTNPPC